MIILPRESAVHTVRMHNLDRVSCSYRTEHRTNAVRGKTIGIGGVHRQSNRFSLRLVP